MKTTGLLIMFIASAKLSVIGADVKNPDFRHEVSKFSQKYDNSSVRYNNQSASARQIKIVGALENDDNGTPDSPSGNQDVIKIPQINFYSSIPNAIGVITNGLLWLRELSAALGTPLPIFIGAIPATIFGLSTMFYPNLQGFGLPLFYPADGDTSDPLSAFPPLPDFSMEDLADMEKIKKALKQLLLIPPGFFN